MVRHARHLPRTGHANSPAAVTVQPARTQRDAPGRRFCSRSTLSRAVRVAALPCGHRRTPARGVSAATSGDIALVKAGTREGQAGTFASSSGAAPPAAHLDEPPVLEANRQRREGQHRRGASRRTRCSEAGRAVPSATNEGRRTSVLLEARCFFASSLAGRRGGRPPHRLLTAMNGSGFCGPRASRVRESSVVRARTRCVCGLGQHQL